MCPTPLSLLEMLTIASEVCSRTLVEADCLPVLLDLIVQTNRSQAALVVVAGIIRILANIAKVRVICCTVNLVCYTSALVSFPVGVHL